MRVPLIPRHPGFLVWNPSGNHPRFVHDELESARTEAMRLSRENPGSSFYVLAPVGMAFVSRPEPTFHTMNPLPFEPTEGDTWERIS